MKSKFIWQTLWQSINDAWLFGVDVKFEAICFTAICSEAKETYYIKIMLQEDRLRQTREIISSHEVIVPEDTAECELALTLWDAACWSVHLQLARLVNQLFTIPQKIYILSVSCFQTLRLKLWVTVFQYLCMSYVSCVCMLCKFVKILIIWKGIQYVFQLRINCVVTYNYGF